MAKDYTFQGNECFPTPDKDFNDMTPDEFQRWLMETIEVNPAARERFFRLGDSLGLPHPDFREPSIQASMNTMQRIAELVPEMKGEMRVPLTREVYEWVTSIAHDEKISQLLQSIPEGNDSPEAEEEIVKAIGRVCERVEKIVPDAGERPTAEIIAMFTAWFPAYRCLSETVPHHEEPPPESPVHEKN